jgi:hypothetical protein
MEINMIVAKLLDLKYNVELGVFISIKGNTATLICYYYLYEPGRNVSSE